MTPDDVSLHRRTRASTIQVFRFSAVTWNPHRIHYDQAYARTEGHPDVLVQSHLHGCLLLDTVREWADGWGEVASFGWQNRGLAVPGDELVITGSAAWSDEAGLWSVTLRTHGPEEQLVATATAAVTDPAAGKAD